jgi:beta-carotene 3-hydroxylase
MFPLLAHAIVWVPVAAATAVLMEPWASWLHDRLWHRALWSIHRTHHAPRRGLLEANDALATVHAPIAMALIPYGCLSPESLWGQIAFGVGVGMTLFAVAYVLIHDGVVHGRLPARRLLGFAYVRRVVRAHRIHHKNLHGGHPFGLFFGPWELARAERRARLQR